MEAIQEKIIFVITNGRSFYCASVNDWFPTMNTYCIYTEERQVKIALALAKKSEPKAEILRYKLVPD